VARYDLVVPDTFEGTLAALAPAEQEEVLEILEALREDPRGGDWIESIGIPEIGLVYFVSGEGVWVSFQVSDEPPIVWVGSCGRYRPPPRML
jgi:hypothetical protein